MATTQSMIALLSRRSPAVAYDLTAPLANLMVVARDRCGDLETALILWEIALTALADPEFRQLDPREIPTLLRFPGHGTNIGSVAEVTHIPRETVSRKVKQLVAMGWVNREAGELRYTPRAYIDMDEVRVATIMLDVRAFEVIRSLTRRNARRPLA